MEQDKESKIVLGSEIAQTDEKRTWRCTVKAGSGEIITIPVEVLLKFLADYNIEVTKYGNHYRAYNITK